MNLKRENCREDVELMIARNMSYNSISYVLDRDFHT